MTDSSTTINPRLSLIHEKLFGVAELDLLQEAIKDFKTSINKYSELATSIKYLCEHPRDDNHTAYFVCQLRKYEAAAYQDFAKLIIALNMTQKIIQAC